MFLGILYVKSSFIMLLGIILIMIWILLLGLMIVYRMVGFISGMVRIIIK